MIQTDGIIMNIESILAELAALTQKKIAKVESLAGGFQPCLSIFNGSPLVYCTFNTHKKEVRID